MEGPDQIAGINTVHRAEPGEPHEIEAEIEALDLAHPEVGARPSRRATSRCVRFSRIRAWRNVLISRRYDSSKIVFFTLKSPQLERLGNGLGVVQPSTPVCLYRGEVVNAIVWDNTAASSNHQFSGTAVRYSSAPDLVHGMDGNITNAPRFISATDYRLGPESACIDAGSDLEVATGVDLAGKPRIVGTAVDLGAFEHAYGGDIEGLPVPIPELWMVLHGFSGDLSAAAWADQDLDGSATWAEYVAGTKPTDSSSVLRVDMLMISTNETALVAWQPSVSGRTNRVISGPSPQTAHSTVAVVPDPASAVTTAVESASSAIFVVEALMEAAP